MLLRKLQKLTVNEIHVRAGQKVSALAERVGLSPLVKLPSSRSLFEHFGRNQGGREIVSPEEFREYLKNRQEPKFFAGMDDRELTISELRRRWPAAERNIIEKANRIAAGKFDLLGLQGLTFGEPVDWHLEPLSGKRTPLVHWSQVDYLDSGLAGDKKIQWELNRHQYLSTLGQAYWLTGDEHYAETFVAHMNSWMDGNPPKLGINWASSLEIAFRSISWIWAIFFFKDSPALSASTLARIMGFLYLNGRHLETYLSTFFSPNTHLTGEALGLFYLGTLFPEFNEAERWRKAGRDILLSQLPRHVQDDGVYFEQTTYYHRYTTDFYIHFWLLSQINGWEPKSEVKLKLNALLDHLLYITRPDGTTPFFGDDDGGRLVMLDQRAANDFRGTLSTGAVLFHRGDLKFVADPAAEETLWLLGTGGLRDLDLLRSEQPQKTSVAFSDGGLYVMRDGWGEKSNYLIFDCGPHGTLNCGHAHADALSFDLAANGRTMLVDPGTFTSRRNLAQVQSKFDFISSVSTHWPFRESQIIRRSTEVSLKILINRPPRASASKTSRIA